jgi:hypothetical protein
MARHFTGPLHISASMNHPKPVTVTEVEVAVSSTVTPDAFGLLPLAGICEKYLGLTYDVARRKYSLGTLAVKAFRLNDSRRGPLYVHVDDLERLIARRRSRAATPLASRGADV